MLSLMSSISWFNRMLCAYIWLFVIEHAMHLTVIVVLCLSTVSVHTVIAKALVPCRGSVSVRLRLSSEENISDGELSKSIQLEHKLADQVRHQHVSH